MFFKLFRKSSSDHRPRLEQDPSLAEEHARRVSAIAFRPSKGFLKDQLQPKRPARSPVHHLVAANPTKHRGPVAGT
jgi:hypothetical protein